MVPLPTVAAAVALATKPMNATTKAATLTGSVTVLVHPNTGTLEDEALSKFLKEDAVLTVKMVATHQNSMILPIIAAVAAVPVTTPTIATNLATATVPSHLKTETLEDGAPLMTEPKILCRKNSARTGATWTEIIGTKNIQSPNLMRS